MESEEASPQHPPPTAVPRPSLQSHFSKQQDGSAICRQDLFLSKKKKNQFLQKGLRSHACGASQWLGMESTALAGQWASNVSTRPLLCLEWARAGSSPDFTDRKWKDRK